MSDDPYSPRRTIAKVVGITCVSALAGFAAVYVTLGLSDNAGPVGEVRKMADDIAAGMSESAPEGKTRPGANEQTGAAEGGDLAAFVKKSPPENVADVTFIDGAGSAKSLSDFRGKVILLNLWATWCAPCKAEMPSLDRLQANLGSDQFEVVALALDRKGRAAAQAFLDETKSSNLKLYIDETAKAGTALKVVGMPATILIDRDGRELGRLVGPAEWDSPAAIALIKAAINNNNS